MIIVLPIFGNKACFGVFSCVTEWVRPDCDKKFRKSDVSAFFDPFYGDFMPENIGKFPYFHKNRDISKTRFLKLVRPGK